jgi:hypothetical protein
MFWFGLEEKDERILLPKMMERDFKKFLGLCKTYLSLLYHFVAFWKHGITSKRGFRLVLYNPFLYHRLGQVNKIKESLSRVTYFSLV